MIGCHTLPYLCGQTDGREPKEAAR
jgi:hypothetical protein